MFRLFVIILVLLIPISASAQNIGIQWAKFNLGIHDSQANLGTRGTLAEFGISTVLAGVKASYTLTTGLSSSETLTSTGSFIIGSTDFGRQGTNANPAASAQRPVRLDWTVKPSHRIEFSRQFWRGISPLVIIRRDAITLTATGEDASGQSIRAEESVTDWGLALGGEIAAIMPNDLARLKVAGMSDYLTVELSYHHRIWAYGFIGAGYQYEDIELQKNRLRKSALFANFEILF